MKSDLLLLVEDDLIMQDLLEDTLIRAGFEVVTANTGAQAMAELDLEATRFRAVITDIKLGTGPDGWEVGQHARGLVANIPIIYVSGTSQHEWTSKGVSNSVFFTKPYAPNRMLTAVATLLTESGARRTARTVSATPSGGTLI
jgi:DNA-binding response OmpR family regulator